jgi:RimJ/RimL family protein N-acetyltransferase
VSIEVRRLLADDAARWQALRLAALQDSPTAFASSYEEEKDRELASVNSMLSSGGVFGGFSHDTLCCIASVHAESMRKMAHKGGVWGVYAAPSARGRGLARRVMQALMAHARDAMGLEFLTLGVNMNNTAALRLYENLGFTHVGIERGFLKVEGVLHDELLMQKDLR